MAHKCYDKFHILIKKFAISFQLHKFHTANGTLQISDRTIGIFKPLNDSFHSIISFLHFNSD